MIDYLIYLRQSTLRLPLESPSPIALSTVFLFHSVKHLVRLISNLMLGSFAELYGNPKDRSRVWSEEEKRLGNFTSFKRYRLFLKTLIIRSLFPSSFLICSPGCALFRVPMLVSFGRAAQFHIIPVNLKDVN